MYDTSGSSQVGKEFLAATALPVGWTTAAHQLDNTDGLRMPKLGTEEEALQADIAVDKADKAAGCRQAPMRCISILCFLVLCLGFNIVSFVSARLLCLGHNSLRCEM